MSDNLVLLVQNLGIDPAVLGKILSSLVAVLILAGIYQIILRGIIRRIEEPRSRYRWKKTVGYLVSVLGVLLVGQIWVEGFQSVATYLGLLTAGLAIALRDVLTDLLGWVYLLWRKPLEVGDRVQVGNHIGDVIDQGVFQFTLMEVGNWVSAEQSTGRLLYISNSEVFRGVIANYTKGFQFIWNEIPVLLAFDSNWEKAKQILTDIAYETVESLDDRIEERYRKISEHYMIQQGKFTPIVYTSANENGILLTLRYLCDPRRRRDSTHQVWEKILRAFAQHPDIRFANQAQAPLVLTEQL